MYWRQFYNSVLFPCIKKGLNDILPEEVRTHQCIRSLLHSLVLHARYVLKIFVKECDKESFLYLFDMLDVSSSTILLLFCLLFHTLPCLILKFSSILLNSLQFSSFWFDLLIHNKHLSCHHHVQYVFNFLATK
jgi:hypothetical protein